MIKFIRMFIIIGAIVLCSGCNKNDNKNHVEDDTSDSVSQQETSYENIQNAGNYFKDTNTIQDYNPNQVYVSTNIIQTVQNDLMYSVVEELDENYKYKRIIYVADLKTGVQIPLCSKVDCNHNNDKCNAYLEGIFSNMWCIDGIIYLFGTRDQDINKISEYFLMRISSDGSIREDLGSVLTVYGDSNEGTIDGSTATVLVHRGYLYYVLMERKDIKIIDGVVQYGKTIEKVYRYNINGKSEPECIYEYTIEEGDLITTLAAQGEYIYITSAYRFWDFSGEISSEYKYEEYKININTLEKEEITSGENYCRDAESDSIIYTNNYNSAGNIVTVESDKTLEFEDRLKIKVSFYDKETEETRYLTENYLEEDECFWPDDFWITDKYICINTYNGKTRGRAYVFDFDWNLIKKLDQRIDHCFGEYILWYEGSGGQYDYYIGNLEDYINGNEKCGRIYKLIDKPQGSIRDMNRYIYED